MLKYPFESIACVESSLLIVLVCVYLFKLYVLKLNNYSQNMLLYKLTYTIIWRSPEPFRTVLGSISFKSGTVLNSSEVLEVSGTVPNRSGEISGTVPNRSTNPK